jgi:prolyl-tRNA synthetase
MKWSKYFLKTERNAPKDAVLDSYKLLYRGGFIRQISTGRYAYLPIGMRVKEKVINIISQELAKIGIQRVELPIMQPIEIWEVTNRDKVWGDQMLVLDDHYGRKFALSATAESLMAELVKGFTPSYKDLPINIYQFLPKFRDELRPRGGLMRAREFLMMDGYNFEKSEKDFMKTYEDYQKAYTKIFKRMDLETIMVEADSGALGGDYCHEFMVESESGGDTFVTCDKCGYKANVERAQYTPEPVNMDEEEKPMETVDQPEWVDTMENNQKHYGKPVSNYLKNVVFVDDDDRIIIVALRGDLEANPVKISKLLGGVGIRYADDKDIERFGSKSGWVHSWGHDEGRDDVIYIADESLKTSRNMIGGQKEKDIDTINVNYGRDFKHKLEGDVSVAYDGAKCAKCEEGHLKIEKCIEVGHIFKYDHYYTDPHKAYFIDKDGKEKPMWMGAYGIGVGRAIATVAQLHHDDNGIIWPKTVAPFLIHIVPVDDSKQVQEEAGRLYDEVNKKYPGEALLDDRKGLSAGIKFADADLLGIPVRIVVSKKNMEGGKIEVKMRAEDKPQLIDRDDKEKLWRLLDN